MARVRVDIFRTVRVVSLAVASALLLAVPARADPITLTFAGDVDLSAHGGAASNPFSGFVTWNTASVGRRRSATRRLCRRTRIFLAQMLGVSEWTDEIPGGGSGNDIFLGQGSFTITGTRVEVIPEPATLALMAFGLAGALARARRSRR